MLIQLHWHLIDNKLGGFQGSCLLAYGTTLGIHHGQTRQLTVTETAHILNLLGVKCGVEWYVELLKRARDDVWSKDKLQFGRSGRVKDCCGFQERQHYVKMGNGGEFELSQEVLAVLPSDPYEQLDVARRITAMAISTRMSKLESETGKLRQRLAEKEHVILGLQERVAEAQSTLQETNSKITQSMDEQAKLATEKNSLALQVKKLMRDVAKLETFKRTLMQSLQEEDDKHGGEGGNNRGEPQSLALYKATQAETLSKAQIFEDDGRYARASFSANPPQYHDDADSKSATPTSQSARNSPKQIIRGTSSARGTPSLTPRLTPTGSPKPQPKKGSPLPSSYTLDSQHIQIPTSQPTSRSSSPPSSGSGQSRTTRLDGKEFFRQARARLSYEQFSSFLANIKELNAHRQTREETLANAEDIFGPENRDLYAAFEGILSRHLPS